MPLFPISNPLMSNQTVLNVSNDWPWNPKLTLKVNNLCLEIKARYSASRVLSKHTFKIFQKEKRKQDLQAGVSPSSKRQLTNTQQR